MAQPRVLILRAPGTNCDLETAFAFERAGGRAERLHVNRLLETPTSLGDFQILCIPGGFSYGDDVAAGRILGNQIRHHLADVLHEFKAAGKLILGICNGFQVLIKSRRAAADWPTTHRPGHADLERLGPLRRPLGAAGGIGSQVRLLRAASSRCTCRSPMPKASSCRATSACWRSSKRRAARAALCPGQGVPVRFNRDVAAELTATFHYPDNPNGSMADVAGSLRRARAGSVG